MKRKVINSTGTWTARSPVEIVVATAQHRASGPRPKNTSPQVFLRAMLVVLILASASAAQENWPTKNWSSAAPAAVGLDPKLLAEFDADIAAGKYGYIG